MSFAHPPGANVDLHNDTDPPSSPSPADHHMPDSTPDTTPVSPPQKRKRLEDGQQPVNAWELEALSAPPLVPPSVTPPNDDPTSYPYIAALDPAAFMGLPTGRAANPHLQMSRSGTAPAQPLLPHRPFPEGPFQIAPIPPSELKGNLSKEQIEELERLQTGPTPQEVLAIVPHGAGKAINLGAKQLVADTQGFLRELMFEENDRKSYPVVVRAPDPRNTGGPNSKPFSRPFPFFLVLPKTGAAPLKAFLMWQRVFAVSKTISFTVYTFDEDVLLWDIYPISGSTITPDASHYDVLEQKELVLEAIKRDINSNPQYRSWAAKMACAHLNHSGDLMRALDTLSNTFHLERTEADDGEGGQTPVYVLMARPPTTDADDYNLWRDFFTSNGKQIREAFRIALQRFDIALLPTRVWCELCKSRLHCTARCPFPNAEGWLGITPYDLGVKTTSLNPARYAGPPGANKVVDIIKRFHEAFQTGAGGAASSRGAARPRGSARGARGQRGRGG
ncbi:hypothetical protein OH77DRAFT_1446276 [Trametes cingulata]|nr:hypothetical protein OH77DRAFT_1446276 [Trametes cingulata]